MATSLRNSALRALLLAAVAVQAACILVISGATDTTPTATATPGPGSDVDECILYFQGSNSSDLFTAYYIEMPSSKWANGTVSLAGGANQDPAVDAVIARFLFYDQPGQFVSGVATVGTFSLSGIPGSGATSPGAGFSFSDTDSLVITGLSTSAVGGVGSIAQGTLSPADVFVSTAFQAQTVPLLGSVSVNFGGSQLYLGSDTASGPAADATWAGCFHGPSYLPQ